MSRMSCSGSQAGAGWVRALLCLVLMALVPVPGAIASEEHAHHSHHAMPAAASDDIIGLQLNDFELLDHRGELHRLYRYQDAPAVVIMTQGNGCPIVRNAMPVFAQVRENFRTSGVEFLLLNSNLQDNAETVAREVRDFGWDFPVLLDQQQQVGTALRVTRTAEIFVIDTRDWRLVYHGPVDDRLSYQVQRAEARHTYLADALDAVLAGEPVPVAQVDAPGCIVNFPAGAQH